MAKCSECGFLASRGVHSRQLGETEQEIRLNGGSVIVLNTGKPFNLFEPPICFMRSPDYKAIPFDLRVDKSAVRSEIQRERTCEYFTPRQQGFTPKEHRDMLDRQWMLEREERRDREVKKWQGNQTILALIGMGIFTILGAIIGALIAKGSIP